MAPDAGRVVVEVLDADERRLGPAEVAPSLDPRHHVATPRDAPEEVVRRQEDQARAARRYDGLVTNESWRRNDSRPGRKDLRRG
jgi:hypothetical protein